MDRTCNRCNYAEELKIDHINGISYVYICYNQKSDGYGTVNSEFYSCGLFRENISETKCV